MHPSHKSKITIIEKKSPRKGTKTIPCGALLVAILFSSIEKKSPKKGTKTASSCFLSSATSVIEKKSPKKGTKTSR